MHQPLATRATYRASRLIIALLLVLATCLTQLVAPVAATIQHTPPWADNFEYSYSNGEHTHEAANPAMAQQRAIGYDARQLHNYDKAWVDDMMVNDAVWSIYAHANSDLMELHNGEFFHRVDVSSNNLQGLKVAVFYGCCTAQNTDNLPKSAYQVGTGAGLGFANVVYLAAWNQNTTTQNPAWYWSDWFWGRMSSGSTISYSASAARDRMTSIYGWDMGTGGFRIYGRQDQRITPAGYK